MKTTIINSNLATTKPTLTHTPSVDDKTEVQKGLRTTTGTHAGALPSWLIQGYQYMEQTVPTLFQGTMYSLKA